MMRKILLSLAGVLAVIVLLVVGAFGYAQTRIAKAQITDMVQNTLTTETQTAEVGGLEGILPFDVRLGRFSLADDTGTWLEVDNARVKVNPSRLLVGEIHVEEAGAARVAVHRAPDLLEVLDPEPVPDEPFSLPEPPTLPESLPRVVVDRLFVDRIELSEALIGQDAVFNLEGNATTGPEGRRGEARLDIVRIDEATASFGLDAVLDLDTESIGLEVEGRETGGLMATLTGQPEAGDLTLRLVGDGPLTDWRAELAFAIENLVEADADLALAYGENPMVDLALTVLPVPGALPPDIEAVLGERLELDLAGGQRAPGHFALERLNLESGIVTATGALEAHLDDDRLDGQIRVVATDLSRASGLAGQELGGRVDLALDALGSFTEPRFNLVIDGDSIVADGFGVGDVDLAFTADLLRPLDQPFAGVTLEGGGRLAGLTQNGEPLRPENNLALDLAATVPTEGEARVERLTVRGEHVVVDGTANVMMPELAGTARLTGQVPSLQGLLVALGPDVPPDLDATGSLDFEADIDLAAELERITIDLALRGQDVAGLPQGLDQLVGPTPRATSRIVVRPDQEVEVQSLEVATAGLGLTGELALGLGEVQTLSGQFDLSPFALETIEGLIDQPIEGEVRSSIQLSGTLQEPGVDADLRVDNLFIADRSFDRVALTAQAGETDGRYGGNVVLGVEQAGDTLQLRSDFVLDQPRLDLSNLRLSGPATDLAGEAVVDLETLLATGNLAGRIGDLAALEPWTGEDLRGSIDLDARFDGTAGRQDADVALAADDIAGDFGALRRARVQASVEDVMDRLAVDAEITAAGFAPPDPDGVVLDEAAIRVTGDRDLFNLAADAQGDLGGPFNLSARARADVMGETQAVFIDELDGVFQAQRITLVSPATVRLEDGVLDIDQLDLRIGDARIRGNMLLDQQQNRALAGLVIDELPMAMLAEFGAPPLHGELTGRFDLRGTLTSPIIEGGFEIVGLQIADRWQTAGVPADVTFELALDADGLVTATRITGLGERPIAADFRVPLQLSLQPFAFDLPQTAPLDGRLMAQTRLEPLAALAALDGQQVVGNLDLDLRLSGTVGSPVASGYLDISNGRVTDAVSGIILTDVAVRLVGDGRRLEVERFDARDRAGGWLQVTGGIAIDPNEAFPYRFLLTTRDLRVLDSDLGRAAVTADILMEGSGRGGMTSGSIVVPRADLRIPAAGAIQPAELDVEVRGAEPRPEPVVRTDPDDRYAMRLDLEIDMPARIFVRGRGLDSEWGGNLEVTGTTSEPQILGSIDFRRGFMDFLDRRFDIREGSVTFTGATPPVPEVYIEAAATTRTMTGIVRVSGPVEDLEFELTSEPELPPDEVLSQLLFDRGTQGLSPIQGVRLASAIARLEGGGGFDAIEAVRDVTGLDVLDLRNAEFGDEEAETTATAGRYVTDRVFIAVDQGLTTGATRGRVEIEVMRNITVRGEVDDRSRSGVGIEWRMDY